MKSSKKDFAPRICRTNPALQEKTEFKALVENWARHLKVEPAQIRIQRMRSKWASCSPGKWVTFSESLLEESRAFQNYVIVHELLHLRVPNHGRLFKSLMSVYVPGWEKLAKISSKTNSLDYSY